MHNVHSELKTNKLFGLLITACCFAAEIEKNSELQKMTIRLDQQTHMIRARCVRADIVFICFIITRFKKSFCFVKLY